MANDEPLLKSTPLACNTAFPLKFRAPLGSTIFPKLENGLPMLLGGRRGTAGSAKLGLPAPRPAPAAPPPTLGAAPEPLISLSLKLGLGRLPARPPPLPRTTDEGSGYECAREAPAGPADSERETRAKAAAALSKPKEFVAGWPAGDDGEPRFAI